MQKNVLPMMAVAVLGFAVPSTELLAQLPGAVNPSGGISVGYRAFNNNSNTGLGISAVQGSSRSMSSGSPSVTGLSGQPSFIFNGNQRPFVTGVVPSVSGRYSPSLYAEERYQALRNRLNRGRALSVRPTAPMSYPARTMTRQQAAWNSLLPAGSEMKVRGDVVSAAPAATLKTVSKNSRDYLERGRTAEKNGKPGVAIIYYRLAAKRAASETSKREALARLKVLEQSARVERAAR